jgi:hypothetical protein
MEMKGSRSISRGLLLMLLEGVIVAALFVTISANAAPNPPIIPTKYINERALPDTGQARDGVLNLMAYQDNGDGTITDLVTGLMWQQGDGGEMTWENALNYPKTMTLGGYHDWRLPSTHELLSIVDYSRLNPAHNPRYFIRTGAEYWWSGTPMAGDSFLIWVLNAGGGLGPHPRNETVSAGGTKRIHVRCVREVSK